MKLRKHLRGVTLLELLIVTVIVGIMAVIAYPNYRQYAARAKRTEAKAMLLEIAQNQERFYLQNNRYGDAGDLGYPKISDSGSYSVTIDAADTNDFAATATYLRSDEEASKCSTFNIDGRGNKTSAPYADCWSRTR